MGTSNIDTLRDVSQDQGGLVTTAQALELGVSRKRMSEFVADGRVDRVRQGLYLVVPVPEDEHRELRIAWLLLDPTRFGWDRLDDAVPAGVVSHRSAARMHRLGDLDADIAELSTTRRIRLRLPHTCLRTATLDREDWTVVDGLPVTTAVRTVADLAAVRTDAGHLAGVVLDALVADYASMSEVAAALGEHALSYGYRSGEEFVTALLRITGVPGNLQALAEVTRPASAKPGARPSDLVVQALFDKVRDGLIPMFEVPEGMVPKLEVPEGLFPKPQVLQGLISNFEVPQGLIPNFEVPQGLLPNFEVPEGLFPKPQVSDAFLAGLFNPDLLGPAPSSGVGAVPESGRPFSAEVAGSPAAEHPRTEQQREQHGEQQREQHGDDPE